MNNIDNFATIERKLFQMQSPMSHPFKYANENVWSVTSAPSTVRCLLALSYEYSWAFSNPVLSGTPHQIIPTIIL